MKAYLKNYRQSPRKVRIVADFVRGKEVSRALAELDFVPRRASKTIKKVILSATANAVNNFKVSKEALTVKEITVDEGVTLKRFRARARGRASRINKRTSNVSVVLGVKESAEVAAK
jgi:large subunit ribosomal protein L22